MRDHNSNRLAVHPFRDDPYFKEYQMIGPPIRQVVSQIHGNSGSAADATAVDTARRRPSVKSSRSVENSDTTSDDASTVQKKTKVATPKATATKSADSTVRKPKTPKSADPVASTVNSTSAETVAAETNKSAKSVRAPKQYVSTETLAASYSVFAEDFLGASAKDKKALFRSFITDLAPL